MEYYWAVRAYGENMANKIAQRIQELRSADNLESLVHYSIGRIHPLIGNRDGEYAMDLVHPYRLVFEIIEDKVSIVRILSIEDYH